MKGSKLKGIVMLLWTHITSFFGNIPNVWTSEAICWDICVTYFQGESQKEQREEYIKKVKELRDSFDLKAP